YVFSCASASAAPRVFKIDDEKNRDVVSFNSDAPIELIVGNTNKINGSITIDDSMDLSKAAQASFDVDLSTIDTGIPLRNEHMRDNFLQTKQFPKATFVLKKLVNPPKSLKPGSKVKLNAVGDFTCHGKTVSKTVPIELTYFTKCAATETKRPGCDLLQFKAVFPVGLKDHNITRPEIVFQKLADTVIVTVSATAYNQVEGAGSKEADPKATGHQSKK
ncbi:MAG: YceI family protein, partial [Candidatus Obscuribacterales bacterium]|nr:YceI family protein [Candidatus Obscuribacterales bacterium]